MMKGLQMGACYFMVKPLRIEGLKNIWQHVVKKRIEQPWNSLSCIGGTNPLCEDSKTMAVEDSSDDDDDESTIDRHSKSRKRHHNDNESSDVGEEKRRMVWHPELHAKFLSAVSTLGFNKVVPKTILRLMKVPGLRREHIASHLQKYRMHLKRRAEAMQNEPCNANRSYAARYGPASTQSASNLRYGASLAQLTGSKSFLGALQPTLHGGGPSSGSSSSSNTNFRPSNAAPRLTTFLHAAAIQALVRWVDLIQSQHHRIVAIHSMISTQPPWRGLVLLVWMSSWG
ncbi:Two-component response regulator ARR2 [Acorus calamus]|uniref:Two-component response regulator ARR2 n=1 Tax=Acorus calamus TaxID=4465 RepID=A0AAV9DJF2_ACOCL|nr:Two-component response regulator ARR2 [Acorus calamus]